jgi:predicted Zn-dependent protease
MCNRHDAAAADAALIDFSAVGRRDVLRGAAAGALALAAGACTTTNPETGREQFIIIDDASLEQAALQAWAQQLQQERVWNNRTAQTRLERVGQRIVNAAGRGGQPWEFRLFDSPQKNAFVLPARKVGFYRGLYEICERDDWMATVLGHETGHVTGRHAAERYSQTAATQLGLQIVGTQVNSQLAMAALGLGAQVGLLLPFSREQEAEADILGLNYMRRAGYAPREAIPFWERMNASGGSRPPEFLSTHPDPDNRIQRIRNYINQQGWGPV